MANALVSPELGLRLSLSVADFDDVGDPGAGLAGPDSTGPMLPQGRPESPEGPRRSKYPEPYPRSTASGKLDSTPAVVCGLFPTR